MFSLQHVYYFVSLCIAVSCDVVYKDVVTDKGVVRGYNSDADNVFSFYGISYAASTTGENRFKGPQPRSPWDGVFEATEKNIICPQQPSFLDTFQSVNRSLDCLRVNVFAPDTNQTDLPVMVVIHGGAYQTGYGMNFSPMPLVQRGIVAVNFNYRVGVQGFLCLGTSSAPGNAGLKDQNAALRWVKTNIAKFGGDPDNITINGGSAGGTSAECQYTSRLSKGLFSKVILESGSMAPSGVINVDPLEPAKSFANTSEAIQIEDLEEYYTSLDDEMLSVQTNVQFLPCIETHQLEGVEKFFDKHPKEILMGNDYEPKPLITGFTPMEGLLYADQFEATKEVIQTNFSSLLPTDIIFASSEQKEEITQKVKDFYFPGGNITKLGYIYLMTDTIFAYPQVVSARVHAKQPEPVFLFLFNYNSTVNLPSIINSDIKGPGHVVSSLFVQEYDYKPIYENMTDTDRLIQEELREMWINFIVQGKPTPINANVSIDWPAMAADQDIYLNVDMPMSVGVDPIQERVNLWDQIYNQMASNSLTTETSLV